MSGIAVKLDLVIQGIDFVIPERNQRFSFLSQRFSGEMPVHAQQVRLAVLKVGRGQEPFELNNVVDVQAVIPVLQIFMRKRLRQLLL